MRNSNKRDGEIINQPIPWLVDFALIEIAIFIEPFSALVKAQCFEKGQGLFTKPLIAIVAHSMPPYGLSV